VEELEQMVATLLAAKRIVGAEAEARERVLREALNSLIEWQYYVTKKAKADDLREWHSRLAAARAALGEKP
jgi:ribosomal protein L17